MKKVANQDILHCETCLRLLIGTVLGSKISHHGYSGEILKKSTILSLHPKSY